MSADSPGDARVTPRDQGAALPSRVHGLWLVTALSLALNVTGMTWGLPARWHPDEKADVVARMIEQGTLRPDSFINPSLPLYLMLGPLWVQARVGALGLLAGPAADPLLAGRMLAALAGAAAVYLVGRLGAGRSLSLLPALLLALSPAVTNLCHFATPEAFLLLGTAACLKLALSHLEGGTPEWLLGLVVGLTASTKYTAAALLVPALAAVLLRPEATTGEPNASAGQTARRRMASRILALTFGALVLGFGVALSRGLDVSIAERLHLPDARLLHPERALQFVRELGLAALLCGTLALGIAWLSGSKQPRARRLARTECVVLILTAGFGFLLGSPYTLLRPLSFLSDLAFNAQTRFEYKGLVGESTSFLPYLTLLGEALTAPLLGATFLGAIVATWRGLRGDARALVMLLAALAPYMLVAFSGHRALRFLAPVLPPAAWLAGLCLASVPSARIARLVTSVVVARAALGALLVVRLFHVDSRILAGRWMESHVPPGAIVDLISNNPGYAPSLLPGRTLRVVPTLSREMAPPDRFAEAALRYPTEASPWLVLTASYFERFLDHPEQRPERAAFFAALLAGRGGFEVVARFQQEGWRRPPVEFLDPEIVILRKRPLGAP